MFGDKVWWQPQGLSLPLPVQGIPCTPVLGGFTAVSWFCDKELMFSPCPCCSLPWPQSSWDFYLLLSMLISPYFYSFSCLFPCWGLSNMYWVSSSLSAGSYKISLWSVPQILHSMHPPNLLSLPDFVQWNKSRFAQQNFSHKLLRTALLNAG